LVSDSDDSDGESVSEALYSEGGADQSDDEIVDSFPDLCPAVKHRKYSGHTVHFLTIAASEKPGRLTPATTSREHMLRIVKGVYGASIVWWAAFAERHAASRRAWERRVHYHIVLKLNRRVRWMKMAAGLRQKGIFAHLSLPTRHADVWRILKYCYVPSLKKGLQELDADPLFSSQFPVVDLEKKFKNAMHGSHQLRPAEFYMALSKLETPPQNYGQLVEWCTLQQRRGISAFHNFLVRQGAKAPSLFKAWQSLLAGRSMDSLRSQRLAMWKQAADSPCSCTSVDRLRGALQKVLELHDKSPARFGWAVERAITLGSSVKNSGVLLYGESNAGKTCLTRPLMSIFGNRCFLRPSRGDTFPLEDLEEKLVAVFQDFRLETSPTSWDTLLLLLEGECVPAARKGQPSILVHSPPPFIITTQRAVCPQKHGELDALEQRAFNNRFYLRWHLRMAIPVEDRDPQLQLCYNCKGCYARFIQTNAEAYALANGDEAAELLALAAALAKHQAVEQQQRQTELLSLRQRNRSRSPHRSPSVTPWTPEGTPPSGYQQLPREPAHMPRESEWPSHLPRPPPPPAGWDAGRLIFHVARVFMIVSQ
jgi:hypothetical protein